ncbi:unnamed protein product [Oncorhynchus mykiss]|uniref:Transposase Tc1-like domain-containing protein n=1 Tax=Oncorhynchus mykiss TaxID=8022 RepID=A0A060YXH3_ONCMY|nr:unnamed protein product [Oncorhynchus mykiss]
MFICTNNSTQELTPWDHAAIILLRKETCSVSWRLTYFGAKSANQSQNHRKGPCEDAGGNKYKVSISTVKRVLYRHNLKGCSARKKPLLQNRHKKSQTTAGHDDKDCTFWRNVFWSDETKIELFGHNEHCYVWRKKEACKPKNTIPTVKHRVAASCFGAALLKEGLVHFTK